MMVHGQIVEMVAPILTDIIHKEFERCLRENESITPINIVCLNHKPEDAVLYTKTLPWDVVIPLVKKDMFGELKSEARKMAMSAGHTVIADASLPGAKMSYPNDPQKRTVTISPLYVESTKEPYGLTMQIYVRRNQEGVASSAIEAWFFGM